MWGGSSDAFVSEVISAEQEPARKADDHFPSKQGSERALSASVSEPGLQGKFAGE